MLKSLWIYFRIQLVLATGHDAVLIAKTAFHLWNYTVFQKSEPFLFLWLLRQMLADFNKIYSDITDEEICNQMTYISLITSSWLKNITEYKNKTSRTLWMQKSRIMDHFLATFSKVCSVPAVSNFYLEIL